MAVWGCIARYWIGCEACGVTPESSRTSRADRARRAHPLKHDCPKETDLRQEYLDIHEPQLAQDGPLASARALTRLRLPSSLQSMLLAEFLRPVFWQTLLGSFWERAFDVRFRKPVALNKPTFGQQKLLWRSSLSPTPIVSSDCAPKFLWTNFW